MDEQMKSRLTSGDVWVRGLYMVLFAIAWGLSELLLTFTVLFQFLTVLFTGSANEPLLRFGQNLSRYHYQIGRFVSFNTEDKPFPFSDWPDDEAGGDRWRDEAPAAVVDTAADPDTSEDADTAADSDSDPATRDPDDVSKSPKDGFPPPA